MAITYPISSSKRDLHTSKSETDVYLRSVSLLELDSSLAEYGKLVGFKRVASTLLRCFGLLTIYSLLVSRDSFIESLISFSLLAVSYTHLTLPTILRV